MLVMIEGHTLRKKIGNIEELNNIRLSIITNKPCAQINAHNQMHVSRNTDLEDL